MKKILLFSLFWFILNLVQSFFTEIINDEAYYWVYSKFLDWGYFDHPPAIAVLIKIGYALLQNETGVRLMNSLLGAGTVFLTLYMIKDEMKDLRPAMLLMLAVPLLHFHVAGFLATPDIPVVFFTALFFFLYKHYLNKNTWLISILLAISVALMLYSKYHAFLVVGFVVLSNLKLLRRWSFWLVVFVSALLYLPHIMWQVKHDFVTFSYHLVERSRAFKLQHLLDYFAGQILLLGPVTGTILLLIGIQKRAEDPFKRSLKVTFLGIFSFFLLSSVRGHVEAHWTAVGYVPLLLYSLPHVERIGFFKKRIALLAGITIPLILVLRLALIIDTTLIPDSLRKRYHGKEKAMCAIESKAGDRPVVFTNSYQNASVYWFFTKKPAFSHNNIHYHLTQYDLLNMEADLAGKQVLYITHQGLPGSDTLRIENKEYITNDVEHYCSYNRVRITPINSEWDFVAGSVAEIELELENTGQDLIDFSVPCSYKPLLMYSIYDKKNDRMRYFDSKVAKLPGLSPVTKSPVSIRMKIPESPGVYQVYFSFGSRGLPPGINGKPVRMHVLSRSTAN